MKPSTTHPRRVLVALTALALATCGLGTAEAAPARHGRAAGFSVDVATGGAFDQGSGSRVVRWNPCAPLRWAIDTDGAPKGFVAEARRAMAENSRATGLQWTYAGTTGLKPQALYGSLDFAPLQAAGLQLVIAWDRRSSARSLLALASGEAGETARIEAGGVTDTDGTATPAPLQLETAAIVLDLGQRASLVRNDRRGNGLYHVLLHELGHAQGLNHVADPRQVMNPLGTPTSPVHYGPGDLAGLHALGAGGCLTPIALP